MALSDYLNGPKYRRQVQDLESQLAELQERYAQMQALAKKYGAMEVLEVQRHIGHENTNLGAVRMAIQTAERDVAALAHQASELRGQILVFEETLLLESFALYQPKFKLNASHEYKTRLDSVRDRQKAMIKNGEAATGNMGWEVNGSKAECVFRPIVTARFGIVTAEFGNVTDHFGDVTDDVLMAA